MNPHQVTREFEAALCAYTGAKYAVTVTSCTMALLLAMAWQIRQRPREGSTVMLEGRQEIIVARPLVEIPKRTYVSVPMSIMHAGGRPVFRDEDWRGAYELRPWAVWDSARWFTEGLYRKIDHDGHFVCVSFHASKTLADSQGGAILHDNPEADAWLRRMRFDGRTEGVAPATDTFREVAYHAYLSPDVAARLLWKLSVLPRENEPLANDPYPDLSEMEIFR